MKLTKQEIKSIQKYYPAFDLKKIKEVTQEVPIGSFIMISNGNKELHDSGYPLIKIIGISGKEFYNLGENHDHVICNQSVNIDSFGKNIFQIMPWGNRKDKWVTAPFWCSTFELTETGYLR
jgi:hypothetical protein